MAKSCVLLIFFTQYGEASSCGAYRGRAGHGMKINNAQVLGSHNSYHVGNVIWDYTHPPLDEQLRLGVRAFELDIWYNVDTGNFSVLHVPGADEGTTCSTLSECLNQVKTWSDNNPLHFPLFFQLELLGGLQKGVTAADQCLYADVDPVVQCAVQNCVGQPANMLPVCVQTNCLAVVLQVGAAKSSCSNLLTCLTAESTGSASMTADSIVGTVQECVGTGADSNMQVSIDATDYPLVAQNLTNVLNAVFPESRRIAPKDLFTSGVTETSALGNYSHASGNFWPEVDSSRGKVIFWLTQAPWLALELPSSTRPVFIDGSDLVVRKSDEPVGVDALVSTGALVRTRSDEDLVLLTSRRSAALDSGAFVISTDFFPTSAVAPAGFTDWPSLNTAQQVWIPLGTPVRCNSVTLGNLSANCSSDMLEDPSAVTCSSTAPATTTPMTSTEVDQSTSVPVDTTSEKIISFSSASQDVSTSTSTTSAAGDTTTSETSFTLFSASLDVSTVTSTRSITVESTTSENTLTSSLASPDVSSLTSDTTSENIVVSSSTSKAVSSVISTTSAATVDMTTSLNMYSTSSSSQFVSTLTTTTSATVATTSNHIVTSSSASQDAATLASTTSAAGDATKIETSFSSSSASQDVSVVTSTTSMTFESTTSENTLTSSLASPDVSSLTSDTTSENIVVSSSTSQAVSSVISTTSAATVDMTTSLNMFSTYSSSQFVSTLTTTTSAAVVTTAIQDAATLASTTSAAGDATKSETTFSSSSASQDVFIVTSTTRMTAESTTSENMFTSSSASLDASASTSTASFVVDTTSYNIVNYFSTSQDVSIVASTTSSESMFTSSTSLFASIATSTTSAAGDTTASKNIGTSSASSQALAIVSSTTSGAVHTTSESSVTSSSTIPDVAIVSSTTGAAVDTTSEAIATSSLAVHSTRVAADTTVPTESALNVSQSFAIASLEAFGSIDDLAAAYKSAIVIASSVADSKVIVEIVRVTVKVTLQFAGPAPSVTAMKEAIAQSAGLSTSAVSIISSRRLGHMRKAQGSRRLNTVYVAEIDAAQSNSTSGDVVQKAKKIHTSLQNKTALEAALTQKVGTSIVLSSTSLTFEGDAKAIIETSASTVLNSTFADVVGQAIGGNVTIEDVVEVPTPLSPTTTELGATQTSTTSVEHLITSSSAYEDVATDTLTSVDQSAIVAVDTTTSKHLINLMDSASRSMLQLLVLSMFLALVDNIL